MTERKDVTIYDARNMFYLRLPAEQLVKYTDYVTIEADYASLRQEVEKLKKEIGHMGRDAVSMSLWVDEAKRDTEFYKNQWTEAKLAKIEAETQRDRAVELLRDIVGIPVPFEQEASAEGEVLLLVNRRDARAFLATLSEPTTEVKE